MDCLSQHTRKGISRFYNLRPDKTGAQLRHCQFRTSQPPNLLLLRRCYPACSNRPLFSSPRTFQGKLGSPHHRLKALHAPSFPETPALFARWSFLQFRIRPAPEKKSQNQTPTNPTPAVRLSAGQSPNRSRCSCCPPTAGRSLAPVSDRPRRHRALLPCPAFLPPERGSGRLQSRRHGQSQSAVQSRTA